MRDVDSMFGSAARAGGSVATSSLSAVSRTDQRPVTGRDRRVHVRAEIAGGDRDVDRPALDLLAPDLLGVTLSIGSADAICQRASEALAGRHLHLQDWVLDRGTVHVDETGWRTSGEGRALWTATTAGAVFFPDRRALQPRAVRRADRHQLPRDRGL